MAERIAIELGYSESHVSGIPQVATRKLGARSRIDLVRLLAAASNPSQARAQRHGVDGVLIHFPLRAEPR